MAPTQEGGGEAMVAIIQRLRDTGLAVTLMSAPRGYSAHKPVRRRVPVSRASVETNTEPRRTTSAQICDSHYATSYQLAHCRLNPTSPAPDLPEFPAQRGAPSRSRGNFRVGLSDSGGSTRLRQAKSRGTFSCDSVARFAASLRNYPLEGRSASTELVHRLLNYTQEKYLSKNPTRSSRSFHSPRTSHNKCNKSSNKSTNKLSNKCSKVNKDIQTYTRIVNEIVKEKVKGRRSMKNASVDAILSTNPFDQPTKSHSYRKPQSVQSSIYTGGTEVRYLSDIRRVIRDTVRQMVDATSPVPCSNAACRYKEHKRLHHRSDSATSPLENESDENQKDSQISETYDYLKSGACDRSSYTEHRECTDSAGQCSELCIDEVKKFIQKTIKQMVECNSTCSKKVSICKEKGLQFLKDTVSTPTQIREEEEELSDENSSVAKVDAQTSDVCPGPTSAVCPNVMSRYRQHRKFYHDEELKVDDDEKEEVKPPDYCYPPPKTKPSFFSLGKPCICDENKKKHDSMDDLMVYVDDDDEYSTGAIDIDMEEQVMAWITKLPVYTDNLEENQTKILEMAQELIEKLNALNDRPDYDERTLEEIKAFLDKLPYPVEEDKSKAKTPSLEEKDVNNAELDELRDIISRWLDCLHINQRDEGEKTVLVDEFVRHLMPMIEKNETPKEFKSKVLELVYNTEQGKGVNTQDDDLSEHADDLVSELHYLSLRRHERKNKLIRKKFLEPIYEWLMESDVPEPVKEKHRHLASRTDSKLRHLVANGVDEDAMHGEIHDFFESMPKDTLQLSRNRKSRLSDLFIKQIKYGLSPMSSNEKLQAANDLLKNILPKTNERRGKTFQSMQPVQDWLKNNPYIEEEDKENNRNLAKQFDEKLQQLQSENINGEEVENEINEFLNTLSEKGIPITPDQKSVLAKKVRDGMKSSLITGKKTSFPSNKPISKWIQNAPNIPKQVKEKYKKVFLDFDEKLLKLKTQDLGENVIVDEVTAMLNSLPLLPTQKNEIAQNIFKVLQDDSPENELSEQPATDWFENAPNIPKQIKQKHRNYVKDFDEKLQEMKSRCDENGVIEDEIGEFVDTLSQNGVPIAPEHKNEVVKTIFKGLKPSLTKPQPITKTASEWLESAPNAPKQVKQENENLARDFDERLQELKYNDVEDAIIEGEIYDFLDTITRKGVSVSPKQKSETARNILKELKSMPTTSQTSKQSASAWSKNAPNMPTQMNENNENVFDNFEEKVHQMKAENVDEQEEIKNEFVDSLPAKGIKVTPSEKAAPKTSKKEEVKTSVISNKLPTTKWLNDNNIPKAVKQKNINLVEDFDSKLVEMNLQNAGDKLIENDINVSLDKLSRKDVPLSPTQKRDISKKVLKDTNSANVQTQPAMKWLQNTTNIPAQTKLKQTQIINDFNRKIQQTRANNFDEETIQGEINEFIDSQPKKGINHTPEQKNGLSLDLQTQASETSEVRKRPAMNWVTSTPKQAKKKEAQSLTEWIEKSPDITKQTKDNNRTLFINFDKSIEQMKTNDVDEDVIQNKINEFVDSLSKKGIKLGPIEKQKLKSSLKDWSQSSEKSRDGIKQETKSFYENEFVEPLTKNLKKFKMEPETSNVGYSSTSDKCEVTGTLRSASEWLESSIDIPKQVKIKNRNFVKKFDQELNKLKSDKASDHAIENRIRSFLGDLPDKGISVTPEEKDRLKKSLLDVSEESSRKTVRPVTNWLDSSLNIPERIKSKTHDIVDNFDDKLLRLRTGNATEEEIEAEISDFLDVLKQQGIGMTPQEKAQLVKKFLAESKMMLDTVSSAEFPSSLEYSDNTLEKMNQTNRKRWSQSSDSKLFSFKPETGNAIKDGVNSILEKFDIPPEIRDKVEKSIAGALADALLHGTSDKELENTLMDILRNSGVSEEEAKRIVADLIKQKKQMGKDLNTPDSSSISSEMKKTINYEVGNILDKFDIPPEYRDEVDNSIANAFADALLHGTSDKELEKTLMDILRTAGVSEEEAKQIVADLMKQKKQMGKDLNTPDSSSLNSEIKKTISYEVGNILDKFDIPPEYRDEVDKSIANAFADALLHGTSDKELEKTLMDILRNAGVSEEEAKRIVTDLMKQKKQMGKDLNTPDSSSLNSEIKKTISYEVGNILDKFDIPPEYRDEVDKSIANAFADALLHGTSDKELEKTLMDILRKAGVSEEEAKRIVTDLMKQTKQMGKDLTTLDASLPNSEEKKASKKGADVLLDDLTQWVESLPIESNTPEEKENASKIKQDIKGKLIHKIGELNMNPEIFNDDFLYKDMLEDEVDRLLLNTGSENVKKQLSKLRNNFLDIVTKARQKMRDENAAQVYKQQLEDAIARTLPSFQLTSPEERASLDVLKDEIADDFISMHYVNGDPNEINRLKDKINGAIYDFCMKHLRRCPAAPLDTRQINQVLYPALESIPEPQNDSFRYEVEVVKVKEIIKNWLKRLPLGYQSELKKLQTSKMISVLAKKLLDIENEQLDADEHNDILKKEIIRFLKKLPLNTNCEEELNEFTNDLIQRFKDTQELRKINAAYRHCVDACIRPCSYRPSPCTLSQEDLEHLDRIKKRNRVRRKISFKDACLSPCSAETSTQTELGNLMESCPGQDISLGRRSSSVQTHCRKMQAVGSQICPKVIVNEHNWESGQTSMPTESSISSCGVPIPRRMPCTRRFQSPNRPSPRPECTSRHSQIQNCNRPSYCQTTSPNTSNYQTQCEPHYQESSTTPSQIPSKPTQCRSEASRMPCTAEQCVSPRSTQNFPQRYSDDNYISEPSQAVFSREDQNNTPVSAHPSPRNNCKPPAQKNMRDGGFTICDPCPKAMTQRSPCQRIQGNQRNQRGPDPFTMSSRQVSGPSYQTQSSDPYSSSPDQSQFCYRQPYFMSSTPISSDDFDPCRFQNRVTRATHLGSFDHTDRRLPTVPNFNQNTFGYEYWDTEHRSNPSGNEESHRKRCRCKPKCGKYKGRRKPCHLANDEAMSSCAKCCGVHCPFPSYMFFG